MNENPDKISGNSSPGKPNLSKDTSQPGREEEVITQQNNPQGNNPENLDKKTPETGEQQYREGMFNNDNEAQQQ